jgi:membrane protease YdiL (CAAX protease family)
MQTTSSPTSATLSPGYRPVAFFGWSAVAATFIALGFASRYSDTGDTSHLFYEYSFAWQTVVAYAVLIGITLAISLTFERPARTIGIRRFTWRWVGIAVGLIILVLLLASALEPILHGGRDQGLSPKTWEPEHAGAFALNAVIVSTLVPFTEELFFRGLGVPALRFVGAISAVVVTGLVFGLSHGILGALPPLVFFGIALGWVRLRADSVWPGVVAHGFYNGVGVLIIYLQLAY